jgi:hypothetical protein
VFDPSGRTPLTAAAAGCAVVAGGILTVDNAVLYLLYERLGIYLGIAKLVTEVSLFLAISPFRSTSCSPGGGRPPTAPSSDDDARPA